MVNTPARTTPFIKSLGEDEGKVVRALCGGHAPSIASAVMRLSGVREAIVNTLMDSINTECSTLCKTPQGVKSRFQHIPVEDAANFKWSNLVQELETVCPLLLKILTTVAVRRDPRSKTKADSSHFPGMCTAAAVLLKERNRRMCGIQSVVSLLMYSCHCEKQVK